MKIPQWLADLGVFVTAYPLALIGAVAVGLGLVAWFRGAYPTHRAAGGWMVIALASAGLIIWPAAWPVVLSMDVLWLLILLFDLWWMPRRRDFTATRTLPRIMSLGKFATVQLEVSNRSRRPWQATVVDDRPDEFSAEPEEWAGMLAANSRTQWEYRLASQRRGLFQLEAIFLRLPSRGGLWAAYWSIPLSSEVHVYPNMQQLAEYSLLARTNRLSLMGVRRTRRIGQDNEFERLREYSRDDQHRHIDWRASARKQKLMVKDFQANQNQNIIFMVDCGRMMTGLADEITMLDHALNALLMLSYIALQRGDSVGLLLFSDQIHSYTPPRSGGRHVQRLLHAVFDRHAEFVESRFDQAFLYLQRQCRKRSLVVLFTNVIDDVNAGMVGSYLEQVANQHLPLGVLLRDPELFRWDGARGDVGGQPSELSLDPFAASAAADVIQWRARLLIRLQNSGALTLDCTPSQLTAALVNRYLEIKARHLL